MAGFEAGLRDLGKKLDKLARSSKDIAKLVEKAIDDDLAQNFAEQRDPYGNSWKVRKREPKDGHPILDDTGALKGSRKVKATDGSVMIAYTDPKASYHQDGTDNLPKRLLVPTKGKGIPPKWREQIKKAFRWKLEELLSG